MNYIFREVRTEHAKEVRRTTGTNDSRDKEVVIEIAEVMPTIATSLTRDNLLIKIWWCQNSQKENNDL